MPGVTTIVKRFNFEAAHLLPNHNGHCARLHGHSYIVDVGVTGPVNPVRGESDEGMVIDFAEVSAAFKQNVHAVCDHQYLNDVLPLVVTTAENIAAWIFGEMEAALRLRSDTVSVSFVRVWETATGYAEVRP